MRWCFVGVARFVRCFRCDASEWYRRRQYKRLSCQICWPNNLLFVTHYGVLISGQDLCVVVGSAEFQPFLGFTATERDRALQNTLDEADEPGITSFNCLDQRLLVRNRRCLLGDDGIFLAGHANDGIQSRHNIRGIRTSQYLHPIDSE